ncbi:hypothetical protein [Dyadobacter psychrotolerans]|uniref:Uncharacterized protein n=1 Tax=Dyadobacter psychrotolerans TaxID=2541721 RepID=A0A4R5DMT2_9BACT|nr:hypothetical protein [Dyadobacter psychrotolerans]TDE13360.1 hypothetical protein E0F88_20180 [Dyadobacter psychrotolerans]
MKKERKVISAILAAAMAVTSLNPLQAQTAKQPFISGVYPGLAMYNNEGECGTGAVVPWAGRLWVVTYGPHLPFGSSDKLYEITPDHKQIVREESIGGTPANRMIHPESNQLFIGPYAIDAKGKVRVLPWETMPGRHTGNARHLTDPAGKIYYGTMEEGFYDVDVKTLKPTMLYEDGNVANKKKTDSSPNPAGLLLPGAHGKGLYSGLGVMVFSNNGESGPKALTQFDIESGSLSEWDGKNWKVVRRNQFVEVTGPGGIYGNKNPATDPIWATGWDHRSVLLGVRDNSNWTFYRLPKASHTYDGAHGWNTEWPRIRDVGTAAKPEYLMTMHGMFWHFPGTFTSKNTAGIRPRSAYLKVIGDFARWQDQIVFGCDDSAQKEFLNKRKAKGDIEGPGQSNSNLWFTPLAKPDQLGPNTAEGAIWISENTGTKPSEPFLFAGWQHRMGWVLNEGTTAVSFKFETDKNGTNQWTTIKTVNAEPGKAVSIVFDAAEKGEWVRVTSSQSTIATIHFSYTDTGRFTKAADPMFNGIAALSSTDYSAGLMYGLGDNRRGLGLLAGKVSNGKFSESGYYELNAAMQLEKKNDTKTASFIREKFAIPTNVVTIDESSVLIVDDLKRRWRLPLGNAAFTGKTNENLLRVAREVATERDLMNVHGTFYELPAENADGFAKIRPVSSHQMGVYDFASYRGLLVMTGLNSDAKAGEHIIKSADGKASVWAGTIDDLWKLGKPVGQGGPWKDSQVKKDVASDPYLIGFYDKKKLKLSHDLKQPVTFRIEAEPVGHGPWMTYKEIVVPAGKTVDYVFPDSFQSRWIRFAANQDCKATSWLIYE